MSDKIDDGGPAFPQYVGRRPEGEAMSEGSKHTPTPHVWIELSEFVSLKGDRYVAAARAGSMRVRADELLREANQLLADAEALERLARGGN